MRRARASPGGVCLLTLLMSTVIVSTDAKTARPSYYPSYDYDESFRPSRDAKEKSGHLPIAPHYPSHGRPPTYYGPEPDFYGRPSHHAPETAIDFSEQDFSYDAPLYRDAYEPPVYRPKPQYDEPEYEPHSPAHAEPDVKRKPSYKEPVHKPRPAYDEPVYKPRPAYEESAYEEPTYKPRPAYQEPAYKPKPAYEEPAYKPKPAYQEPAYKPKPAYQEPAYKPKPAYQEPAYKPKPAYREPAHKPKPAYEEPQGYSKPKTTHQDQSDQHHKSYEPKNTIPGEAGVDYPIYDKIPATKFTCDSVPYRPGMYANPEASCQVYHVCNDDRYGSRGAEFLCTNGTIFNQKTFSCDWWYNVDCDKATEYYALNSDQEHNPYYQKPQEPEESEYKTDPKPRVSPSYHKPRPTSSPRKPEPSYHKPEPSYHKPEPSPHKPRPTPSPRTAKPVYHQTPRPSHRATTFKPSFRQTPKPSYHVTSARPSYRTPAPRAAYRSPIPAYSRPEPAYHRPEPSYQTPSPSYRRPVRRPTSESSKPSHREEDLEGFYSVGEDGEIEFGPDFEWGARF